jgi:RNA recognition motif-containing protein
VEGIPSSWGQTKLTEIFKSYGKIEDIFLSHDTQSSQKRGCACIKYMTHEAAIFCLESFDKEELTENGSKVSSHTLLRLNQSFFFLLYIVFTSLVGVSR